MWKQRWDKALFRLSALRSANWGFEGLIWLSSFLVRKLRKVPGTEKNRFPPVVYPSFLGVEWAVLQRRCPHCLTSSQLYWVWCSIWSRSNYNQYSNEWVKHTSHIGTGCSTGLDCDDMVYEWFGIALGRQCVKSFLGCRQWFFNSTIFCFSGNCFFNNYYS